LRRKNRQSRDVRVAPLAALPDDGVPRLFQVIYETLDDAWTRHRDVSAGAVYLIRAPGSTDVKALHATCPHLGCFVDYQSDRQAFGCPCHKSTFDVAGVRTGGVSPRDMDELPCRVRDGAIWVKFENFHAGRPEKEPEA
jgi:Rieske Fe-S protein